MSKREFPYQLSLVFSSDTRTNAETRARLLVSRVFVSSTSARMIKTFSFSCACCCDYVIIFLVKTEHENRIRNVFELFFSSSNQSTHSGFVRGLTKIAEAEGSFQEKFCQKGATVPYYL